MKNDRKPSQPNSAEQTQIWAKRKFEPTLISPPFNYTSHFCTLLHLSLPLPLSAPVAFVGHGKMQAMARRVVHQSLKPSASLKSIYYPISDHRTPPSTSAWFFLSSLFLFQLIGDYKLLLQIMERIMNVSCPPSLPRAWVTSSARVLVDDHLSG